MPTVCNGVFLAYPIGQGISRSFNHGQIWPLVIYSEIGLSRFMAFRRVLSTKIGSIHSGNGACKMSAISFADSARTLIKGISSAR